MKGFSSGGVAVSASSDIDKLMAKLAAQDLKSSQKNPATATMKRNKKSNPLIIPGTGSDEEELSIDQQDDEEDSLSALDDDDDDDSSFDDDDDDAAGSDSSRSPRLATADGGSTMPSWLEPSVKQSNSDNSVASPMANTAAGTGNNNAITTIPSSATASSPAASPSSTPSGSFYSRFASDFDKLSLLGQGGFGAVWLVRNKVDKLLYAVKKIKLRKNNPHMNKKIVKEGEKRRNTNNK